MIGFLGSLVCLAIELVFGVQFVVVSLSAFASWVIRDNELARNAAEADADVQVDEEFVPNLTGALAWLWEWLVSSVRTLLWPWGMVAPARGDVHAGSRPILLVHGYRMNWSVWWYMMRQLRADGLQNVRAFNLPHGAELEEQARVLTGEIRRAAELAQQPVDLVCHSMGGIVARLALAADTALPVRRVVTIGTPHRGTLLAFLALGPAARSLGRQSQVLQTLNDQPLDDRIWSIGSSHDNIILPASSTWYVPERHRQLAFLGHNALLVSEQVYAVLRPWLTEEDTTDAS